MSEINMYCEEIYCGEIFPEIYLIQIGEIDKENPYIAPNGIKAKKGRYGLTISNDPFVIFSKKPINGWNDDNLSLEEWLKKESTFKKYKKELRGEVNDLGRLWESCRKSGYNPKKHGYLAGWICSEMYKYITHNNYKEVRKPISEL